MRRPQGKVITSEVTMKLGDITSEEVNAAVKNGRTTNVEGQTIHPQSCSKPSQGKHLTL